MKQTILHCRTALSAFPYLIVVHSIPFRQILEFHLSPFVLYFPRLLHLLDANFLLHSCSSDNCSSHCDLPRFTSKDSGLHIVHRGETNPCYHYLHQQLKRSTVWQLPRPPYIPSTFSSKLERWVSLLISSTYYKSPMLPIRWCMFPQPGSLSQNYRDGLFVRIKKTGKIIFGTSYTFRREALNTLSTLFDH